MERNRTILHIDDDPSLLRLTSKKLSLHDYHVHSLEDASHTWQELASTGARLVLLDIDMPEIDGLTLLKEIKRRDGGIQVIMLTGMVSMSTALQSMRWGAEACVFKPISDLAPLLAAIKASFEKIDRWWLALDELHHRKSSDQQTVGTLSH